MNAGIRVVYPRYFSSMTSPLRTPRSSARCGLTHAVVSQVNFVNGFGSSCSQPLFARLPSQIVGSGRKMISSPPSEGGDCGGGTGAGAGVGGGDATGGAAARPAAGEAAASGVG